MGTTPGAAVAPCTQPGSQNRTVRVPQRKRCAQSAAEVEGRGSPQALSRRSLHWPSHQDQERKGEAGPRIPPALSTLLQSSFHLPLSCPPHAEAALAVRLPSRSSPSRIGAPRESDAARRLFAGHRTGSHLDRDRGTTRPDDCCWGRDPTSRLHPATRTRSPSSRCSHSTPSCASVMNVTLLHVCALGYGKVLPGSPPARGSLAVTPGSFWGAARLRLSHPRGASITQGHILTVAPMYRACAAGWGPQRQPFPRDCPRVAAHHGSAGGALAHLTPGGRGNDTHPVLQQRTDRTPTSWGPEERRVPVFSAAAARGCGCLPPGLRVVSSMSTLQRRVAHQHHHHHRAGWGGGATQWQVRAGR